MIEVGRTPLLFETWIEDETRLIRHAIEGLRLDGSLCAVGLVYVAAGDPLLSVVGALTEAERDQLLGGRDHEHALMDLWSPPDWPSQVDIVPMYGDVDARARVSARVRRGLRASGSSAPWTDMTEAVAAALVRDPPTVERTSDFLAFAVEHDSEELFERLPRYVPPAVLESLRQRDLLRYGRLDDLPWQA